MGAVAAREPGLVVHESYLILFTTTCRGNTTSDSHCQGLQHTHIYIYYYCPVSLYIHNIVFIYNIYIYNFVLYICWGSPYPFGTPSANLVNLAMFYMPLQMGRE